MTNPVFVNESISLQQDRTKIIERVREIVPKLLHKLHKPETKYVITTNSEFNLYGYTNLLFLVKPQASKDSYLLRIYGDSVVNRERELKYVLELQKFNIGPAIYGIFNNGRIEHFYDDAVIVDPLKGYSKSNKIAKAIVDFHKIQISNSKTLIKTEGLWSTVNEWFNAASNLSINDFNNNTEQYNKYIALDWNNISNQINWMKSCLLPQQNILNSEENALKIMEYNYGKNVKYLIKTNQDFKLEFIARNFLYQSVLCHNDVYVGNILQLSDTNEVVLIDFEYVSVNYRGHDFATFFGKCGRHEFNKSEICDAKERKEFIEFYLNEFEYFTDKNNFTEQEFNRLLHKCDCVILEFCMMNAYVWGIWAVNQAVLTQLKGFDFIDYAKLRLHYQFQYFKDLWYQQYKQTIVCMPNSKL